VSEFYDRRFWVILVMYEISQSGNICMYRVMATVRVDVELHRVAAEMFAREAAADVLVVEAGVCD